MLRSKSRWIASAAFVALAVSPTPAAADDNETCRIQSGDAAIAACSRLIATGRNLATTRVIRGNKYAEMGDLDRAIADFSAAIRLDPKYVDAYDGRGEAYTHRADYDRAIADVNHAIALDPKDAQAYFNRGHVYVLKGDYDRSIADFDRAIQFSPRWDAAYYNRGFSYAGKGDWDRAIADYTQAIAINPKYDHAVSMRGRAYYSRGRANLLSGALPKALADLNQAVEANPRYAYAALSLDIANKRSNLPSRLADAEKQIDMTVWPAPVIRLYLGQLTPEAVLAAADDPNPETKKGQVCEANFYTGELALQQANKDEARRLFGLAAADCPKDFDEYDGAVAELKALGTRQ